MGAIIGNACLVFVVGWGVLKLIEWSLKGVFFVLFEWRR